MIFTLKKILYLLLGLIFFFSACGKEKTASVREMQQDKRLPSQEGYDSSLYISKAGVVQAVLHYGHMRKYNDEKIVYFDEGIELDFYNAEGKNTSSISAREGEFYENTEDVIGRGNVIVVSDTGMTLFTQELRWDNELNKIFSDTLVMITTQDGDTLYGKGFESDPDLRRRVIYQPWGVSSDKVEIDKIREEFMETAQDPVDTTKNSDTLKVRKQYD